jgi:hypothetical protein
MILGIDQISKPSQRKSEGRRQERMIRRSIEEKEEPHPLRELKKG